MEEEGGGREQWREKVRGEVGGEKAGGERTERPAPQGRNASTAAACTRGEADKRTPSTPRDKTMLLAHPQRGGGLGRYICQMKHAHQSIFSPKR